jgi:excisionase family DNA binding protein
MSGTQAGVVSGLNSDLGMNVQQERWLSVDEIATHMGVNPDTVYKWIERRRLPAHKMGRLWKFKASEVDEWVRQGKAAEDVETE